MDIDDDIDVDIDCPHDDTGRVAQAITSRRVAGPIDVRAHTLPRIPMVNKIPAGLTKRGRFYVPASTASNELVFDYVTSYARFIERVAQNLNCVTKSTGQGNPAERVKRLSG